MKFPLKFRLNRRLISLCLVLIGFVGPMLASPRMSLAAEGELDHDARLEGYPARSAYLDTGVAADYLLLAALALLAAGVMFKDARRTHKKT